MMVMVIFAHLAATSTVDAMPVESAADMRFVRPTPGSGAVIAVACNDQLFYDAFDVEHNEHACLKLYLL